MPTPTPQEVLDARTAKPEEVEARLREFDRNDRRRRFQRRCDELLAELRDPKPTAPDYSDARAAKPEEVEARLAELIRGR